VLQVVDADVVKEIAIKEFTSFTNKRNVLNENSFITGHIAALKDDHWKHVRSTITPTFTSGKLKQVYIYPVCVGAVV